MHDKTNTYRSPQLIFSQYNLTKLIQNFVRKDFSLQTVLYFSFFIRSPDLKKSPFLQKGGRGD